MVVHCETWLERCIPGVYNELFRVRGFSAGGLVRGNRIHVVYFSQAYISPPLASEKSYVVLIIEMTLCYCDIQRGEKHLILDYLSITLHRGYPLSSCLFYCVEDN